MSSTNSKLSKENKEEAEETRASIIYGRLKRAYDFPYKKDLAKALGISKQTLGGREDNDIVDEQEIIDAFPDVNDDWLFSKDFNVLRRAPVRNEALRVPKAPTGDVKEEPLSDQEKRQILQRIQEIARILKGNL